MSSLTFWNVYLTFYKQNFRFFIKNLYTYFQVNRKLIKKPGTIGLIYQNHNDFLNSITLAH